MITLMCGKSQLEALDINCTDQMELSLNKTDFSFAFIIKNGTKCVIQCHESLYDIACNSSLFLEFDRNYQYKLFQRPCLYSENEEAHTHYTHEEKSHTKLKSFIVVLILFCLITSLIRRSIAK